MKAYTRVHALVLTTALTAAGMAGLFGCGKSSFDASATNAQNNAPGSYEIPAKVDILLAVDDTGSALNADVRTPLVNFMNRLNDRKWDFRVAVTPLSAFNAKGIQQVAVSKYDVKYGGNYVAPYPGAPSSGSSIAVYPSSLLLPGAGSSTGGEPGINTIAQTLENEARYLDGGATRFLRPDAVTYVILVSTSDDTTEGSAASGSPHSLSSVLVNRIRQAKGLEGQLGVKVYSFVNAETFQNPSGPYTVKTSCLGPGSSYSGNRYMMLAQATEGKIFDVCSGSVDSIFTQLDTAIDNERANYKSEYVFVDKVPDLTTVVMKRVNADGTSTVIPDASKSSDGGWTYLEGQASYPSISSPIKMNFRYGYAFKLSPKYQLTGNQKPVVTFTERGLTNSK